MVGVHFVRRLGCGMAITSMLLANACLTFAGVAFAEAFPGQNGKIAFSSDRTGDFEIWLMDNNGANQSRLTTNAGADARPSWAPDGTKILFSSAQSGTSQLYLMAPDGSGQTALTNLSGGASQGTWSPDGSKIAFNHGDQIHVMDADGSNIVNLSSNAFAESEPSWSPDGSKIAFNSNRDGDFEVYVMGADGSNPALRDEVWGGVRSGRSS